MQPNSSRTASTVYIKVRSCGTYGYTHSRILDGENDVSESETHKYLERMATMQFQTAGRCPRARVTRRTHTPYHDRDSRRTVEGRLEKSERMAQSRNTPPPPHSDHKSPCELVELAIRRVEERNKIDLELYLDQRRTARV